MMKLRKKLRTSKTPRKKQRNSKDVKIIVRQRAQTKFKANRREI